MLFFLLKRIGRSIVTIFFVLLFVFIGSRMTGNPFEKMFPDGITQETEQQLMKQFGLDDPVPIQFIVYLKQILTGNFGISITQKMPVSELFAQDVVQTLRLGFWAFFLSVTLGLSLGIFTAVRPKGNISNFILWLSGLGYAIPNFVIAIILIIIFSYSLHWLPSIGGGNALSYIMPVITLAAHPIASIARYVRNSLLDVIHQDYIRTARTKGLKENTVILNHALKNALIPVITMLGIFVTDLIGGSLIVESVFSWPGMGKRLVGAVMDRDFPVIQFGVICFALVVIIVNLIVDILYVVIDPRIKVDS
jgi:glutathione transport system permease protein